MHTTTGRIENVRALDGVVEKTRAAAYDAIVRGLPIRGEVMLLAVERLIREGYVVRMGNRLFKTDKSMPVAGGRMTR